MFRLLLTFSCENPCGFSTIGAYNGLKLMRTYMHTLRHPHTRTPTHLYMHYCLIYLASIASLPPAAVNLISPQLTAPMPRHIHTHAQTLMHTHASAYTVSASTTLRFN